MQPTSASQRKYEKYCNIHDQGYTFKGLALETMGTFAEEINKFIKEFIKKLVAETGD